MSAAPSAPTAPATDWVIRLLTVELTTESGLRISGPSERDDVDIPVHRDHRGVPVVPGSSLKGVLRSLAERVLAAHGPGLACDILASPCLGQPGGDPVADEALADLCWCCRLFGSPHRGGRLAVGDLTTNDATTVVRDGVGIDRDELCAADGVKFDYEVVVPETTFTGEIRLEDPEPGDLGLVLGLFELISAGVTGLGGATTRGLGRVSLRCAQVRELRASTWTPGSGFTVVPDEELERERSAAVERLEQAGGGGTDG